MADYTLTYSPDVEGWPSFYSFIPDFMIGMNNYFYSFNGGNLYRHNTNAVRNQFYGTNYPSTMTSVFNAAPAENTLWKTIELESDVSWYTELETNIQEGYIDDNWFEKKEAVWFAFVRNTQAIDPSEFVLRSVNGLGNNLTVTGPPNATVISFAFSITSMLSVGDFVFFQFIPTYAGKIIAIDRANNTITIDTTESYPYGNPPVGIPVNGNFILYAKDIEAESHGVLGAYCQFKLTLPIGDLGAPGKAQVPSELFLAEADIMKSYP